MADEQDELLRQVRQVYTDTSARDFPNSCQSRAACCHFRNAGHVPFLTRGEALVAAKAVRARGLRKIAEHPDGACPLINTEGRCTIYESRPFGCRTHFCKEAGGIVPRPLIRDLVQRLEAIDRELGGDGGRNFHSAINQALTELDGKKSRR